MKILNIHLDRRAAEFDGAQEILDSKLCYCGMNMALTAKSFNVLTTQQRLIHEVIALSWNESE